MNKLYLDCEADDLLYGATKIWTIVAYDEVTDSYHIYVDKDAHLCYPKNSNIYTTIEEYLNLIHSYTIITHNGCGYDVPLLYKLYGYKRDLDTVEDTYVLSCLYNPDRPSGHSLADWGEHLRYSKGTHSDWTCLSQEMLDYCIQDVLLTRRIWKVLEEEGKDWDWSLSYRIEKHIASIMAEQERYGVLFDVPKAEVLLSKVESEILQIEDKALSLIPKKASPIGNEVSKVFKKNGDYTEQVKEWLNG